MCPQREVSMSTLKVALIKWQECHTFNYLTTKTYLLTLKLCMCIFHFCTFRSLSRPFDEGKWPVLRLALDNKFSIFLFRSLNRWLQLNSRLYTKNTFARRNDLENLRNYCTNALVFQPTFFLISLLSLY